MQWVEQEIKAAKTYENAEDRTEPRVGGSAGVVSRQT
jgi:hypothetical protein